MQNRISGQSPASPMSEQNARLSVLASLTLAIAATLGACQAFHVPDTQGNPSEQAPLTANYIAPNGGTFDLPPREGSETARDDLFRLADALEEAYRILDFQPPYPKIKIVGRSNPYLVNNAIAAAALDVYGNEQIAFERRRLSGNKNLLPLVIHELAHLKAWRLHGTRIPAHGQKFLKICEHATKRKYCTAEGFD